MAEKKVVESVVFHADSVADLDKFVKGKTLTVVDFWAEWCVPCKSIAPIAEKLAAEAKVDFVKVNIDKVQALSDRYGIRSVPTFLLFKNGKVVDTVIGADKASLKKAIERHA